MKITKNKLRMALVLILVFGIFTYGYTQYLKKGSVSAVLQYQIDLNNPPEQIYAISLFEQKLPDGKELKKGTRFIGKLSKEGDKYIIYFSTIQNPDGESRQVIAKSNLTSNVSGQAVGVSAKIGKTLYKQTKTNVLGAIFHNSQDAKEFPTSVLPQGSPVKIEID
ncbi:MAG: hypothetical protein A3I68_03015 [Candidatus Melainabacteria bacterium RIFCSPLOWO2_02_FULL_35_15]|nr:MAG: hypothetical protein A3F80_06015 [Candidatus Melainabacteria bacterium RIFCSPLOWO2_12_FULL_35_11]OGI13809.1 MAG: hypothetical protein A3I68_03015 [Candidatus Melainabacteria bacterium RIFCSPLOWO2_02_FULL_35_15]